MSPQGHTAEGGLTASRHSPPPTAPPLTPELVGPDLVAGVATEAGKISPPHFPNMSFFTFVSHSVAGNCTSHHVPQRPDSPC